MDKGKNETKKTYFKLGNFIREKLLSMYGITNSKNNKENSDKCDNITKDISEIK